MLKTKPSRTERDRKSFQSQVARAVTQKRSSSKDSHNEVFFGVGTMGMVGWSVAIPTLLGALAGGWIDQHHWSTRSWTLALLIAGLCLGSFNAWYWVDQECKSIDDQGDPTHE